MKILILLHFILLHTTSIFEGTRGQSTTPVPVDSCNRNPFCDDGSFAANPDDCTKYFVCGSGIWQPMNCSAGTYFDTISMQCTFFSEATCLICPPFTGTTPPPITLEPGLCENITRCEIGKYYPDRSNCTTYYYCQNGTYLVYMSCQAGFIFNIYTYNCTKAGNDFSWDDCYYRCVTPSPPTSTASAALATDQSTSTVSTTLNESSGDSEKLVLLIVIIVIILIIIIIIVVACCIKKQRKNVVDPERDTLEDELSGDNENEKMQDSKVQCDPLPPPLSYADVPSGYDHDDFVKKAEQCKRKAMKPFRNSAPTREEAINAVKRYKKKLNKQLQSRHKSEENRYDTYYNKQLEDINNFHLIRIKAFHDSLASGHNNPDELTASVRRYVNNRHAIAIRRQKIMNERDAILRQQLNNMNLTPEQRVRAGLLASDLDGSEVTNRVRRYNEDRQRLEEGFIKSFSLVVAAGATVEELEQRTKDHERRLQELQDNHVNERRQATGRLQQALRFMTLRNLETQWNEKCEVLDGIYDYSQDDDPGTVRNTLAQHLDALHLAAEEVDNITTVAETQMNPAALNPGLEETNTGALGAAALGAGALGVYTAAGIAAVVGERNKTDNAERNSDEIQDSAMANGFGGQRRQPLDAGMLEEEQRRIMETHQQELENLQAMRTRERSRMDKVLRRRLDERRKPLNNGTLDEEDQAN